MKWVPDVKSDDRVVLSDGMGYISRDLMHEVADQLGFSPGVLQVGSGDAVHVVLPHDSS